MAPMARPAAAPTAAPAGPALDPIKIFKKYFWVLVAAGILSSAAGIGTFVVWRKLAPVWNAEVVFEAVPPNSNPEQFDLIGGGRELETFIANQAASLQSPRILERVILDPRLQAEAPVWYGSHVSGGSLNPADALEDLTEMTTVRLEQDTSFYRLIIGYKNPRDAMALAGLVKDVYIAQSAQRINEEVRRRTDSQRTLIQTNERAIADLREQRTRRLRDGDVVTLSLAADSASNDLRIVTAMLNELRNELVTLQTQQEDLQDMLGESGGVAVEVNDSIRASVEASPPVQTLNAQIRQFEVELLAAQRDGLQPEHRTIKAIEGRIAATEAKLADLREELIDLQVFNLIDETAQSIAATQAQIASNEERQRTAEARVADLQRTQIQVTDIDAEIRTREQQLASARQSLDEIERIARDITTVRVAQSERMPSRIASPKLITTVPVVFLLLFGSVTGLIVLRELMDQRIKGPSDVAMIPRAKVLGMIPFANEDPANPKHFETIFRDQPKGVLAEQFRSLRTNLLKRLQAGNHKTVLVLTGAPGSGGTSIIANLAVAIAAVNRRVLIVDANFRRPAIHKVFGQEEHPGLSDALAGEVSVADAIKTTETDGVDVLPAGTRALRVYEQLGSAAMAQLLDDVSEKYDVVLLDVAPAIVAGDGMALATQVDASFLVVKALSEKRGMVARLKNELSDSHAELLGILVNGVRAAAGGYMRSNLRTSHLYENSDESLAEDDKKSGRKSDKKSGKRGTKNEAAPVGATDSYADANEDSGDSDRA